jgi:hypothetical protein
MEKRDGPTVHAPRFSLSGGFSRSLVLEEKTPAYSLIPDAALSSILRRKDMLAVRTASIVAIASSGIRNSLIFGSSLFFSSLFIFRAPAIRVPARVSGCARCACRTRVSLRTRWSCHRSSCGSSGASGDK